MRSFSHISDRLSRLTKRLLPALLVVAGFAAGPVAANSAPVDTSTILGKVMVGYQGWFRCPGDGSPENNWSHWADNTPTADNFGPSMFPDTSEWGDGPARCKLVNLAIGGKSAYVFSSFPQETADIHFRWMRQYNIDGALLQRFIGEVAGYRQEGEAITLHAMKAAEENGRSFAIEYDLSHGNVTVNGQSIPYYSQSDDVILADINNDWEHLVNDLHITDSPAYQRESGKPLVSIWGLGFVNDASRPHSPELVEKIIHWFKDVAHAEVMGGVDANWRGIEQPGWAEVLAELDVVQPWTVGVIDSKPAPDGVEGWRTRNLIPDMARTTANGQLLMPVMLPGTAGRTSDHQASDAGGVRDGGNLLWKEILATHSVGAKLVKVAMFDELDEGTELVKTAANASQAPDTGSWLNLDADGYRLPTDWYLRVMYEAGRVYHGEIEPTATLPSDPGPLDPAPTCGVLQANQSLVVGRPLESCDGTVTLSLGTDGNVVGNRGPTQLYDTGTTGIRVGTAGMQGDGNFVIYDTDGHPRWSTGTAGRPGAYLFVRNDGTTEVVDQGSAVWQANP